MCGWGTCLRLRELDIFPCWAFQSHSLGEWEGVVNLDSSHSRKNLSMTGFGVNDFGSLEKWKLRLKEGRQLSYFQWGMVLVRMSKDRVLALTRWFRGNTSSPHPNWSLTSTTIQATPRWWLTLSKNQSYISIIYLQVVLHDFLLSVSALPYLDLRYLSS